MIFQAKLPVKKRCLRLYGRLICCIFAKIFEYFNYSNFCINRKFPYHRIIFGTQTIGKEDVLLRVACERKVNTTVYIHF